MYYPGLSKVQTAIRSAVTELRPGSYRYPSERWMLVITVFIVVIAFLSSTAFSLQGFVFFIVIGVVVNYFFIRSYIEGFKRDAVLVSDSQFPQIKALIDECRHHVDVSPDTQVFVTYSPIMNAFAVGLGRPYSVVLFSALIDHLDDDELKYVISHELGHIKFGHTIWLTLIGQLGSQTYGIPLLAPLFRFCFLFWSRAAELTADRAGLVGCGKLEKAISAQLKVGAGPWLAQWVNIEALARQARQANGNFFAAFRETWGTHPLLTTRLQRLINFATSETFNWHRPDIRRESHTKNTTAPTPKRAIRKIAPKSTPTTLPPVSSNGASPPTQIDKTGSSIQPPAAPAAPDNKSANWSQEIGFHRLHVSAIRANTEQAEMWLKLGELLQSYGQSSEAVACLERARGLIQGSTLSGTGDNGALNPGDVSLAAGRADNAFLPALAAPACPTCNATALPDRRYCPRCQTQLQKPCLACGVWLPAGHPNCAHCGQNQSQLILTLKTEANSAKKVAQQPLPPRRLTRWEVIYSAIFIVDVLLILATLAWQSYETAPLRTLAYGIGAYLLLQIAIIIAVTVTKKRGRRYWQLFDETDLATRRYNDIADTLAQHHIALEPPRLEPKDPWRWAHHG